VCSSTAIRWNASSSRSVIAVAASVASAEGAGQP
jgi:hypothetical protein